MTTPNFFAEQSPFLQHPLLTAERTAKEVDFIVSTLNLLPNARILDVGCGFGRHSIELARRNYEVVGIDPAAAMIAAAQARARVANVSVNFRQVAGESFVAREPFEAALCLFTTLGQISSAGENSGLVAQVYAALRSGGLFIVEVPQREQAVKALQEFDKFGEGERYTTVTRQFNPQRQWVTETFTIVSPEMTKHYLLCYRLYSLTELTTLLEGVGFSVVMTSASYKTSPLSPDSPTMLVVCRK